MWGSIAAVYGLVLLAAALTMPIKRRAVAATACGAFALAGYGLGTLGTYIAVQFMAPGVLLLVGYWLSGFFFRDPQAWLERALLDSDAHLFRKYGIDRWLQRAPGWILETLEASYAADYVLIAAGAVIALQSGITAIAAYWSLVLACQFTCYGALPWLRSRPPRVLEGGRYDRNEGPLRRLNVAILDRASVQANTLPSGHVAGAMAAALGVLPISTTAAAVFLVIAALIAVAAVLGRYHYAIDCVSGVSVALLLSLAF
jgi:membrane-associated phospholipid phosphatase